MDEYDGFREFAAAHGPALLRTAYVLTGDRHRAEDLLQDIRGWPGTATGTTATATT